MTLMNYFEEHKFSFAEVMKIYRASNYTSISDFLRVDLDKNVPLFNNGDLIVDKNGCAFAVKSFNVQKREYELKFVFGVDESINGMNIIPAYEQEHMETEEQFICEIKYKPICTKLKLHETIKSLNKEDKNEQ